MALSENIDTYRVYILKQRKNGSEVLKDFNTITPFFSCAKIAFLELYKLQFDKNYLILMTKNNKQINAYRYQSIVGDSDYFDEKMELKNEFD